MADCSVVSCPECIAILGAEALKQESPAVQSVGDPAASPTINTLVNMTGEINQANGWYDDDGAIVGPNSPVTRIAATAKVAIPLAYVIEAIRKPESFDLMTHLNHLDFEAGSLRNMRCAYGIQDQENGAPLHGSKTQAIARQMLKVTEVVEGVEAIMADDVENLAEEIADEVIRSFDSVYAWNLAHPDKPIDLEAAILAKLEKNRSRGYRHGGKTA
jgi:NTP pyrophosphatase (non-canonical NTP hydrolase)